MSMRSTAANGTQPGVLEFWQNERFYGLSWGRPLLPFDWPAASDASGVAVALEQPPTREGEGGWIIWRTPGTDQDGWLYANMFPNLSKSRRGGRATRRANDFVRRRMWRKLAVQHEEERDLPGGGALDTAVDAAAARAAVAAAATAAAAQGAPAWRLLPEAEQILLNKVVASAGPAAHGEVPKASIYRLWQIFLDLWNDACARHGFRRLVPLDPLGLFVAVRRHRDLLTRQGRDQLLQPGRLLVAAPASTEVEPDVLSRVTEEEAEAVERAGNAAAEAARAAGASEQQQQEAGMVAAAAAAATYVTAHHTRGGGEVAAGAGAGAGAVGEAPTGASIHEPAGPQPATVRLGGAGAGHWEGTVIGVGGTAGAVVGGDGARDVALGAHQSVIPNMDDPDTMLEEFITATNYSRGAYGYAMAAGHMTSLTNMFAMFGAWADFNPVTDASVEANNEAVHLFTGIPVEDIVMSEWRSACYRPCHYLAVDRQRRRLVLAVRGSLEVGDVATDLTARPVPYDFGPGIGSGYVHEGLMSAAQYVQRNTAAALRHAAAKFPGWPLVVTGHSLGAGAAGLLCLLLRQRDCPESAPPQVPHVMAVCIGSPAVLSDCLTDGARDYCFSVVHSADFVARLSCYSVDRALLELVQASPAAWMMDSLLQGAARMLGFGRAPQRPVGSRSGRLGSRSGRLGSTSGRLGSSSGRLGPRGSRRLGSGGGSAGLKEVLAGQQSARLTAVALQRAMSRRPLAPRGSIPLAQRGSAAHPGARPGAARVAGGAAPPAAADVAAATAAAAAVAAATAAAGAIPASAFSAVGPVDDEDELDEQVAQVDEQAEEDAEFAEALDCLDELVSVASFASVLSTASPSFAPLPPLAVTRQGSMGRPGSHATTPVARLAGISEQPGSREAGGQQGARRGRRRRGAAAAGAAAAVDGTAATSRPSRLARPLLLGSGGSADGAAAAGVADTLTSPNAFGRSAAHAALALWGSPSAASPLSDLSELRQLSDPLLERDALLRVAAAEEEEGERGEGEEAEEVEGEGEEDEQGEGEGDEEDGSVSDLLEALRERQLEGWFGPGFMEPDLDDGEEGEEDEPEAAAEGSEPAAASGGDQPPSAADPAPAPLQPHPSVAPRLLGAAPSLQPLHSMASAWPGLELPAGPEALPPGPTGRYGALPPPVTRQASRFRGALQQPAPPARSGPSSSAASAQGAAQGPGDAAPAGIAQRRSADGGRHPAPPPAPASFLGSRGSKTLPGRSRLSGSGSRPLAGVPENPAAAAPPPRLGAAGSRPLVRRGASFREGAAPAAPALPPLALHLNELPPPEALGAAAGAGPASPTAAVAAAAARGISDIARHAAHKELYPPGKVLWIITDGKEHLDALLAREREQMAADLRAGADGGTGGAAAAGASGAAAATSLPGRLAASLTQLVRSGVGALLRAPPPNLPSMDDEDEDDGDGGGGGADAGQHVYLLDAERTAFHRLVLLPAAIGDHLPDAYMQRLRQLQVGRVPIRVRELPRQGGAAAPERGSLEVPPPQQGQQGQV